jgi:hypothetical protein
LEAEDQERSTKRRRISISPDLDSSSPLAGTSSHRVNYEDILSVNDSESPEPHHDGDGVLGIDEEEESDDQDPGSTSEFSHHSPEPADLGDFITTQKPSEPSSSVQDSEDEFTQTAPAYTAQNHPTFLKAPRFKVPGETTEEPGTRTEHFLPDAFSPQRRGAKYVPGGLAAELRHWLVEVKGYGTDIDEKGGDSGDSTAVGLEIIDVRTGVPGITLVNGRQELPQGEELRVRAILAGAGRVSGLDGPNIARPGCTVLISPPAWDVKLGPLPENKWSVVCDWAVRE